MVEGFVFENKQKSQEEQMIFIEFIAAMISEVLRNKNDGKVPSTLYLVSTQRLIALKFLLHSQTLEAGQPEATVNTCEPLAIS